MSPGNPYLRFAFGILAIAIALNVAWCLIQPVLPALLLVIALIGIVLIVRWWRRRW